MVCDDCKTQLRGTVRGGCQNEFHNPDQSHFVDDSQSRWDAYPLVEIKRCFDTLSNEQRFRLGYTPVVVSDLLGAIADLLPELLPEPVEETLSE